MRFSAVTLLALLACAATAPNPPLDRGRLAASEGEEGAPRALLARFVAATEGARWTEAYALLSARWRGVLTPERLASDYSASGPVGRAAAARVRALLASGVRLAVRDGAAVLRVGEGRAAVLLLEGDGWRVDALE